MAKGYFSIIQFSPDPAHTEAINIGILLSVPELSFLDTKVTDNFSRVKNVLLNKQNDEFMLTAINSFVETIKDDLSRYNSKDELEHLIFTRAHEIQLTELRTIKTDDPQKDLDEIFEQLIPVQQKAQKQKQNILFPDFDRLLRTDEFVNRIEFNKEIKLPILDTRFVAPYAYVNGRTNLIKPVAITGFDIAEKLAYEGVVINEKCDAQLIVMPEVKMTNKNASQKICDLFSLTKVDCYLKADLEKLLSKIRKEAHAFSRENNRICSN